MEKMIDVYYVYDNKEAGLGHIDKIEFPDRDAVHFDAEAGTIDLEVLSGYKGFLMSYHCDGKVKKGYIGKVEPREVAQPDGEIKEVMTVSIEWEDDHSGIDDKE